MAASPKMLLTLKEADTHAQQSYRGKDIYMSGQVQEYKVHLYTLLQHCKHVQHLGASWAANCECER